MKPPTTFLSFLERVLAIRSLSRAQRVWVRVVFDGVEPVDLKGRDRAAALALFGNVDRFPPEARSVLAMVKGARVGGTWLCALWLLWRGLTARLDALAAGELAFAVIVAPDMRLGRQALRFALGAAKACPAIAPLVENESTDAFVLLRPDGHRVQLETLPATRGGSALRGRTLVAALADESSFFRDRESGVVNDSELFRALVIRCTIPGAKLLVISTAWLESGVLHELTEKNHPSKGGRPQSAIACIAPTEVMREGDARIAQVIAEERERDPENAAREFDCIPFGGGTSQFFPAEVIAQCVRPDLPLVVDPTKSTRAGAGCDPAFAAGGDACALVIVHEDGEEATVAEVEEATGGAEARVPGVVCARWAEVANRHGVRGIASDTHYAESLREHFGAAKLSLLDAPNTNEGKVTTYTAARERMARAKVAIPAGHRRLVQQLREVLVKRETGGRTRIFSPRKHGTHGDVASAFVLALWALEQGAGPVDFEEAELSGSRFDAESTSDWRRSGWGGDGNFNPGSFGY